MIYDIEKIVAKSIYIAILIFGAIWIFGAISVLNAMLISNILGKTKTIALMTSNYLNQVCDVTSW